MEERDRDNVMTMILISMIPLGLARGFTVLERNDSLLLCVFMFLFKKGLF